MRALTWRRSCCEWRAFQSRLAPAARDPPRGSDALTAPLMQMNRGSAGVGLLLSRGSGRTNPWVRHRAACVGKCRSCARAGGSCLRRFSRSAPGGSESRLVALLGRRPGSRFPRNAGRTTDSAEMPAPARKQEWREQTNRSGPPPHERHSGAGAFASPGKRAVASAPAQLLARRPRRRRDQR